MQDGPCLAFNSCFAAQHIICYAIEEWPKKLVYVHIRLLYSLSLLKAYTAIIHKQSSGSTLPWHRHITTEYRLAGSHWLLFGTRDAVFST